MPPELVTRTPTRPVRLPVFTQSWTELTYLHWPYPPDAVRRLLPAGVEPDVHDGVTWVGLVPFAMRAVRILGSPALPYLSRFLETNVRVYAVDAAGRRGVVFASLEADRLLPVLAARVAYRLPYCWSAMTYRRDGTEISYGSRRRWPARGLAERGASTVRVRIGEPVEPTPLDDFLTARWGLFTRWYGRTVFAPVWHAAWPLHRAEVLELDDDLVQLAGLPAPSGPPHALHSPGVAVRIGLPRPLPRML